VNLAENLTSKTDTNNGASDIGITLEVYVSVDSRLWVRSSDPNSVTVGDEPSGRGGSGKTTVGCWWRAGDTEVACKVVGEVELTRSIVELDAFGSKASNDRGDASLIAFVGSGGQVVLGDFVDMDASWTNRHTMGVSLSEDGLTRVEARTRTRSRCGQRNHSVGRHRHRLWADDLSVCLLKDLLSKPSTSHDGVDADDAPECVSMFVKTQGGKG
jgi:hypothetical protein